MVIDGDLDVRRFSGADDGQQLDLCLVRCQALGRHPVNDFVHIMLQRLSICS